MLADGPWNELQQEFRKLKKYNSFITLLVIFCSEPCIEIWYVKENILCISMFVCATWSSKDAFFVISSIRNLFTVVVFHAVEDLLRSVDSTEVSTVNISNIVMNCFPGHVQVINRSFLQYFIQQRLIKYRERTRFLWLELVTPTGQLE